MPQVDLVKYALRAGVVVMLCVLLAYVWHQFYSVPRARIAELEHKLLAADASVQQATQTLATAAVACGQFKAQAAQCSAQLEQLARGCAAKRTESDTLAQRMLDSIRDKQRRISSDPAGADRMNKAFRELGS